MPFRKVGFWKALHLENLARGADPSGATAWGALYAAPGRWRAVIPETNESEGGWRELAGIFENAGAASRHAHWVWAQRERWLAKPPKPPLTPDYFLYLPH